MPQIVQQLLVLFTVGLLTAYVVTPIVRRIAFRVSLLDYPDGTRKLHASPTPVAGGPIVLICCTLTIVVGWLMGGETANVLPQQITNHIGLFIAACLICALGVMDDFGRLRGRY